MADMRTVANAVTAYGVDMVLVPQVASGVDEDALPYLSPTYLKRKPVSDGWHNPLYYYGQSLNYTIWSYARDGVVQSPLVLGPTTYLDADIVLSNGLFIQWPEGMQVK